MEENHYESLGEDCQVLCVVWNKKVKMRGSDKILGAPSF